MLFGLTASTALAMVAVPFIQRAASSRLASAEMSQQLLQALERMAASVPEAQVGKSSATRLFWKLVGTTTVLQQRLVAARAELVAVHRRADEAEAACRCALVSLILDCPMMG